MLRIALKDAKTDQMDADSQLLLRLRNNLAFHYGAKVLANGYRAHFADRTKALHDRAVLSDGNSMEETRFYFADAAMDEGLFLSTTLRRDALQVRLTEIAEKVNFALKFIVTRYIRKVTKTFPYPTPA